MARSERWKGKNMAIWERWEGSEHGKWHGFKGQNCVALLQLSEMKGGINCRDLMIGT